MPLVSEEIEKYCLEVSTKPSKICDELFDYTTKNVPNSGMLIGPQVGSLLQFLVRAVQAKRVLEIGCFTGYSALAMAEALPESGELITMDVNEETTKIGQDFWKKSPHGKKIKLILGSALDSLKKITGNLDFVLIDADKANYKNYLQKSLELLSERGVIALDNCLWNGKVIDKSDQTEDTRALREVAEWAAARSDLATTLLPIRDGILLVQKKKG